MVVPLHQINLVPGLSFEVTVNCRALGRKMLVQLGSSMQLAWLVEVDQTPEPRPRH